MTVREAALSKLKLAVAFSADFKVLGLEAQAGAGFLPAPGRPGVEWARSGPGLNNSGPRRVEAPRDLSGLGGKW